jgi:hypothetical protein
MTGFVAVDPANKLIVLSFRGSQSVRNWLTNILFLQTKYNICDDCYVHSGFLSAWVLSRTSIVTAVTAAVAKYPTYKFVVTGHSLGGAVATIAGAWLRVNGFSLDIYSYGSPRVGNTAFANFVTAQTGGNYRVTHLDDPVPRLPPILLGYHHTSPEYWLSTGTDTTVNYSVSDVKICEGISNTTCNAGVDTIDFTSHGYYFSYVPACIPDFSFRLREREEEAGLLYTRNDFTGDLAGVNAPQYSAFMMLDIAYEKALTTEGVGESGWLA